MTSTVRFDPQWTSPPGETLAEIIHARGWTADQFAERIAQPVVVVEGILAGRVPITIGIARRLHHVVGASAAFWMTRDLQYRQDLDRMTHSEADWISSFPLDAMTDLGWLSKEADSHLGELLTFFDVPSVASWRRRYAAVLDSVAFKSSATFESDSGSTVAWIRQGERIATSIPCLPWNDEAVRETLVSLRGLTRVGRPERFLPKVQASMAECGVAVVLLQAPAGCRASGAAMWIAEEKGLILLSARHLSDDHLWFTLYHECGHLLLHRNGDAFIDDDATLGAAETRGHPRALQKSMERDANAFAEATLLTHAVQDALHQVSPTYRDVLKLAARAGIGPGIIAGQLQRMGRAGPERLNGLKRRYRWQDGQLASRETR